MNHAGDSQAFAAACEASLPLRLQVTDERTGRSEEMLVDRPFALVGSSETSDVRLVHPDVSRNHAYLQILEGRVLCCDLASRTGTHWGSEIRSRSWVEIGEPIHIGPFCLRRLENSQSEPPSDEMPILLTDHRSLRVRQPNVALTFLNARNRSGRSRITRVRNPITLVGWSHLCHLRLQHRSVGRVHCSLVWTPTGLWAVDLMWGGTRVNGELINFAQLEGEDTLEMGRFQLRLTYGSSAEFPTLSAEDGPESTPITDLARGSHSEFAPQESAYNGAIWPETQSQTIREPQFTSPSETSVARITSTRHESSELFKTAPSLPMPISGPGDLSAAQMQDATAVTLMQQFAVMQQQMFDHTYHLLSVVTEAFQTAHQRQLQVIRDELTRVHELNRELFELNRQRGTTDTPPTAEGAAAQNPVLSALQSEFVGAMPVDPPIATSSSSASNAQFSPAPQSAGTAVPQGKPATAAPQPVVASAATTHSHQPGAAMPSPAKEKPRRRGGAEGKSPVTADENPADDRRNSPPSTTSGSGSEEKPAVAPVPAPNEDVHAWLSGRIDELTQERSTRWQRILQMLTNGGS